MTRISSPPALDYKCGPSQSADTNRCLVSYGLLCQHSSAWTHNACRLSSAPTVGVPRCGTRRFPFRIIHTAWCCSEYKDRLHNCVADDGQGSLHLRFELRMSEVKGLIEAFSKKQVPHNSQAVACILLSLPISETLPWRMLVTCSACKASPSSLALGCRYSPSAFIRAQAGQGSSSLNTTSSKVKVMHFSVPCHAVTLHVCLLQS